MNQDWNPQAAIDTLRSIVRQGIESSQHQFRVLVVEDEENDAYHLLHLLKQLPCSVTLATNGAKAIEAIKADGFRIMFLDLKMPGMDGVQVARETLSFKPDCVFVVTTGCPEGMLVEAVKALGPVVVIEKPVKMSDLYFVLGLAEGVK